MKVYSYQLFDSLQAISKLAVKLEAKIEEAEKLFVEAPPLKSEEFAARLQRMAMRLNDSSEKVMQIKTQVVEKRGS